MLYTITIIIVWGKGLLIFSMALISYIFSVTFIKHFSSLTWLSQHRRYCEKLLIYLLSNLNFLCRFIPFFPVSVIQTLSFY